MKRTPMPSRHTPLAPRKGYMGRGAARLRRRRAGLRRVGKKGRANARANRLLKRECDRLGIDRCEVGYEGCFGDDYLSFAHVAKRRELRPGELERAACVACFACHRILDEGMSHAAMRAEIEAIIDKREARLAA